MTERNPHGFTVGQKVFVVERSYREMRHCWDTVSKIGRKYGYLPWRGKFDLETGRFGGHYGGCVYANADEYLETEHLDRCWDELQRRMPRWPTRKNIPLGDMKTIARIFGLEVEWPEKRDAPDA